MSRKDLGSVEWIDWGTFRAFGEKHGKTEKGKFGVGKDIRVIGRKVTEWKERKGHLLCDSMITGVYEKGIEILVIGVGAHGAIHCPDSVVEEIKRHGIREVLLLRSPEACETYTRLFREDKRVALLAHATC